MNKQLSRYQRVVAPEMKEQYVMTSWDIVCCCNGSTTRGMTSAYSEGLIREAAHPAGKLWALGAHAGALAFQRGVHRLGLAALVHQRHGVPPHLIMLAHQLCANPHSLSVPSADIHDMQHDWHGSTNRSLGSDEQTDPHSSVC